MINSINLSDFPEREKNVLRATLLLTIATFALGILGLTKISPTLNFLQSNIMVAESFLFLGSLLMLAHTKQKTKTPPQPALKPEIAPQEIIAKPVPEKTLDEILRDITYEKFRDNEVGELERFLKTDFAYVPDWAGTKESVVGFAKFHISVDYKDIQKAFQIIFPILIKEKIVFKIIRVDPEHSLNSQGKEFVLYFPRQEGNKNIAELAKVNGFFDNLIATLEKEGVHHGKSSLGDLPLKHGRSFVFFRFETTSCSKVYLKAEWLVQGDFTREESALLGEEGLNDIFGDQVATREISPDKLFQNKNPEAVDEWEKLLAEIQLRKELSKFFSLMDNFPDVTYEIAEYLEPEEQVKVKLEIFQFVKLCWIGYFEKLFASKLRQIFIHPDKNFSKYWIRTERYELAFGGFFQVDYFYKALIIIEKICKEINPDVKHWRRHAFGIPISTIFYHFFLPVTQLEGISDSIERPFANHPKQEKRLIRELVKCAFRKYGAQSNSINPVYIVPDEQLDQLMQKHAP